MGAWGSDFAALDFNFASDAPVMCPLCPKSFTVTQDCKLLLQHLLEAHHLIIGEVEQVADLRQYILYWGKLRHLKLQDYCVVFSTSSEPGVPAADPSPANTYYLLCDKLPEDYKLRHSLMQMKLRHVVEQKERERQDVSFSRQCIYCSEILTGGVTNCFQHLTQQHSFSLGNPDNIVFGAQLLDILHEKLRNLQCLCCEKIFKTHKMLREHMRKQQHRCLNPKNKVYDKFYLRNYLRPGMPWEETKRNLDEESDTESLSEDAGQAVKCKDEPAWTDWLEVSIHPITCLFCSFTTTKVPAGLFSHMQVHHNFDFQQITHNFNFYQKVKVVNYIRCCMLELQCLQCQSVFATQEALQEHIHNFSHCTLPNPLVWDLPQYHIPVCDNDGLLQHLEDGEMDDPQGSLTSVADQVVYPEDIQPLNDSILYSSSLREELTQNEDKEVDLVVTCLFCGYTVPGERAHMLVYAHMSILHCFDFPEVVSGLSYYTQVKLINFIRRKTAQKECHVCSQVFQDRGALEEHRVLASHTSLPPSHLFQDQSWLKPILEGDGLLQRLREDGDSDDEDPSLPDSSREEVMFGEDVKLPQLTSQLQAITLELLKNDDS
ncbi:zinc finger protein 277-like [Portunus trituberculatus]|uniref:zinc finger protein 277-like n=1 Tax=Portunus trituberculatus TaxID=210409 RepID=UPI001E1CFAD8|nr:zinc finger protein 277-like [Portunus trituberculatus]